MTIRKVLIANRGEIAVRIEKACARESMMSVAVYAEPDRGGLHSRFADEAFPLGSSSLDRELLGSTSTAMNAYRDVTMLLRIARQKRVDAIHPGYGFFAEDADFAQQVIDARLTWIGASPESLREVAAVNSHLPVLEPVAGQRHLEVQLLVDAKGTAIVVGNRDCSVRYRGHALIAESPAPFLGAADREALHAAALKTLAGLTNKPVGPVTVEFARAADGELTLTRITPRLTVGHPATEEATGIDLVRAGLRLADGDALWLTETPKPARHAITARIDVGDHDLDLLEHRAVEMLMPDMRRIRVDAGICEGQAISDEFETPLVKLTAAGRTRFKALERLREAMLGVVIDGCPLTAGLVSSVLDDVEFAPTLGAYKVDTTWLAKREPTYTSADRRLLHEPVSVSIPWASGFARPVQDGDWVDAGDTIATITTMGNCVTFAAPCEGTVYFGGFDPDTPGSVGNVVATIARQH